MEQNESVYSMNNRFTDIVTTLGVLGKTFSNSEKVKKIIMPLPKEWRQKRTVIEEAKDLNILPIYDLIDSLILPVLDLSFFLSILCVCSAFVIEFRICYNITKDCRNFSSDILHSYKG